MFITLPTALDVKLCLMTNGHLCMFNQALYPVEQMNWCVYALFTNNEDQIEKNCVLRTINRTTNLAYSLDGYLWAISALATEKLQLRCVMETRVLTIKPPLQIVDVGNRCKNLFNEHIQHTCEVRTNNDYAVNNTIPVLP